MRRLWLPAPAFRREHAPLTGGAAHRVRDVWRLRSGAELRVFDGAGLERAAVVEVASPRAVALALGDEVASLPEPPRPLVLGCAFPRGSRGDWLVEKATELGVSRLVALDAGRAVLRPGSGRLERWRRVAVEAAEQCGRAVVPEIEAARVAGRESPGAAAPFANSKLLLADHAANQSVVGALAEPGASTMSGGVALVIGPEGGWSPEERTRWLAAGALPVSLGPRVLRVETAAIVGLAQLAAATGALAPADFRFPG